MATASLHGAGFRLVLRAQARAELRIRMADLFGPDGLLNPANEPIPVDLVATERGTRLRVGKDLAERIGALIDRSGALRKDAASDLEFLRSAPLRVYARTCATAAAAVADEEALDRLGRLGDALLTDYGFPPPSPPKSMKKTPAAYTYLGQFLAHELTVFSPADPDASLRADGIIDSAIDLKTIFLRPFGFPRELPKHVEEVEGLPLGETIPDSGTKFPGGGLDDLPRMPDGSALVFDRRNDQNLAVSQTEVAVTRFAQAVRRILQQAGQSDDILHVLRHFQSVVLQDYLPRIVDAETWRDVMRHGRVVVAPSGGSPSPDPFFVPIEFSAAVFRFGHTMVRDNYAPWNTVDPLHTVPSALAGDLLGFTFAGGALTEGQLLQSWTADWRHLLGLRKVKPIMARAIGTGLSTDLFCLPKDLYQPSLFDRPCLGTNPAAINLARRTLIAGGLLGLPTGQACAREVDKKLKQAGSPCRIPILKRRDLDIPDNPAATAIMREGKVRARFVDQTPLWVYTLREAAILGDGNRLGPLGGRILAETLSAAVEASGTGMIVNGIRQPFTPDPRFGGRHKRKFDYRDLVRLAFSPLS